MTAVLSEEEVKEKYIGFPPEAQLAAVSFTNVFFKEARHLKGDVSQSAVNELFRNSIIGSLLRAGRVSLEMSDDEQSAVAKPYIESYRSAIVDIATSLYALCYAHEAQKRFQFRSIYSRVCDHLGGNGLVWEIFATATVEGGSV